jgi:phage terminase large subunit-like protein
MCRSKRGRTPRSPRSTRAGNQRRDPCLQVDPAAVQAVPQGAQAPEAARLPVSVRRREGERVCRFIEKLPHTKGKWARAKETIRLEPWQIWILCCTFGWLRKTTGLRRFRVLFVVVPRKNGKSALSAGIGLYMLCADGEFGAEVYSGATNEKQAWEVFKPARLMAMRTPALCAKFGVEVNARSLVRIDDESKFETITGDPGDGQSPSCSIHDEYHEHADDGQVDTMQTGMGARDQPLQVPDHHRRR